RLDQMPPNKLRSTNNEDVHLGQTLLILRRMEMCVWEHAYVPRWSNTRGEGVRFKRKTLKPHSIDSQKRTLPIKSLTAY
ncbi:MAG: hypothetical protein ABI970_22710, partial [Chloroflexota bacterium]